DPDPAAEPEVGRDEVAAGIGAHEVGLQSVGGFHPDARALLAMVVVDDHRELPPLDPEDRRVARAPLLRRRQRLHERPHALENAEEVLRVRLHPLHGWPRFTTSYSSDTIPDFLYVRWFASLSFACAP